jgi:hypothetical protein
MSPTEGRKLCRDSLLTHLSLLGGGRRNHRPTVVGGVRKITGNSRASVISGEITGEARLLMEEASELSFHEEVGDSLIAPF